MIRRLTTRVLLCLVCALCTAGNNSPIGLWKTFDDHTGRPRGYIRIFEKGGKLFGRAEGAINPDEAKEVCDKCTDERRNQKVMGMLIIRNMEQHGAEYIGGDILDPDTGSVYRCKFHLADGGKKLVVRGFLGVALLGRTQTWVRQE